jgi:predicted transcriptional regulator
MSRKRHAPDPRSQLGARERQIMDVLYGRGRATVSEVLSDLPNPPTYSSVRAMLRYLEDKGFVRHEEDGPRYIYLPSAPKADVRKSVLSHMVDTFFDGSVSSVVAALIEGDPLSSEEHQRLSRLLDHASSRTREK